MSSSPVYYKVLCLQAITSMSPQSSTYKFSCLTGHNKYVPPSPAHTNSRLTGHNKYVSPVQHIQIIVLRATTNMSPQSSTYKFSYLSGHMPSPPQSSNTFRPQVCPPVQHMQSLVTSAIWQFFSLFLAKLIYTYFQ